MLFFVQHTIRAGEVRYKKYKYKKYKSYNGVFHVFQLFHVNRSANLFLLHRIFFYFNRSVKMKHVKNANICKPLVRSHLTVIESVSFVQVLVYYPPIQGIENVHYLGFLNSWDLWPFYFHLIAFTFPHYFLAMRVKEGPPLRTKK